MIALTLFVSTFALVFALGFQSLNVNNHQYRAAFITSFAIGSMQLIMLKLGPDASILESIAFVAGGPFGIVASMCVHRRTMGKRRAEPDPCEAAIRRTVPLGNTARYMIDTTPGDRPQSFYRRMFEQKPPANTNCGADRP
jgi:hypothetical protein